MARSGGLFSVITICINNKYDKIEVNFKVLSKRCLWLATCQLAVYFISYTPYRVVLKLLEPLKVYHIQL